MMKPGQKEYLGDSVYLSFDGWCFILTTENGYPDDPSNKIVLEMAVVKYLFFLITGKELP